MAVQSQVAWPYFLQSLFVYDRMVEKECEVYMDDLLKVGIITNTHGLRGEVKVFPTTDDAKRFLDLDGHFKDERI